MEKEHLTNKKWSREKFYGITIIIAIIFIATFAIVPCSLFSQYGCGYAGGLDIITSAVSGFIIAFICLIIATTIYEFDKLRFIIKKNFRLIVIIALAILVVFFVKNKNEYFFKNTEKINYYSPDVEKRTKGILQIIGEKETFEYSERSDQDQGDLTDYNGNALNDCIASNCKFIYFTSKDQALFNDNDDPAIGVIDKVTLISEGKVVSSSYIPSKRGDQVIYLIIFTQSGKSGQVTTKTEDLCVGYKGGSFNCRKPDFSQGDKVIFVHNPSYGHKYENRGLLPNDTFKAELIGYGYYTVPNIGESFPFVWISR